MIRLFEIENKIIKPTEHCYTITWLKKIMETFPDNYIDVYAYIFYMAYPGQENPYYNLVFDLKEQTILADLKTTIDTEHDDILEAVEKAKVLYETVTVRAYKGITTMLDNLTTYLETALVTDGRDGNINSLLRVAKEFDSIRQSYKGVAKDLEAEQQSSVRGGQQLGYDQLQ
jgi:hypothetical protein